MTFLIKEKVKVDFSEYIQFSNLIILLPTKNQNTLPNLRRVINYKK